MARARGADFSSYQDLTATRAAIAQGVEFGIVKLTEGLGYVNPLAPAQLELLREHGAVVAVYHFLSHDVDGARQWDHFEAHLPGVRCPVAVDHEPDRGVTPSDVTVREFIRRGHQRGHKVGRYGSLNVMTRKLGEDWRWIAKWSPQAPALGWDVWQFADGPGPDWNLFNGDAGELRHWADTMAATTHPRRRQLQPPARWWLHDELATRALGPYRLPRVGAALLAYALRHSRSNRYTIERK
jgi:hypothetical protein